MVFPISDDNTDRTAFPVINVALILVNVIVFVVFQQMGSNVDFTFAFFDGARRNRARTGHRDR